MIFINERYSDLFTNKKEEIFVKISLFPAAPLRQLVCMYLFYPSYLDDGPPTLNFKQNIFVHNGFHFLLGHCVHQQLLEQREHPQRMQVNDEVGHGRIFVRVLFLFGGEPCLDQPGRTVGVAFAKMFQRRALGVEQQDFQHRPRCMSISETYSSMQAFRYFSERIVITSSPRIP